MSAHFDRTARAAIISAVTKWLQSDRYRAQTIAVGAARLSLATPSEPYQQWGSLREMS